MKIIVTGGAGFIGSHLVGKLLEMDNEVVVYDNLSSGRKEFFLDAVAKSEKGKLIIGDVLNYKKLVEAMKGCEFVFHLAAEIMVPNNDENVHFQQNVVGTKNVLDAMVECNVKNIVFSSSSAVYGNANVVPTPETYGPCIPISMYGASKLAGEALIFAYAEKYKFNAKIMRFANIIGKRSMHGVIFDFVEKLKKNEKELIILGDGQQRKSYLHVSDCVEGMIKIWKIEGKDIYNLGAIDSLDAKTIAEIVANKMNLKPKFVCKGGESWKGDIKVIQLEIEKMKNIGWMPKYNSKQAVEKAVEEMLG